MNIHHAFPYLLDEIVEEAEARNVCDARRIADWDDEEENENNDRSICR